MSTYLAKMPTLTRVFERLSEINPRNTTSAISNLTNTCFAKKCSLLCDALGEPSDPTIANTLEVIRTILRVFIGCQVAAVLLKAMLIRLGVSRIPMWVTFIIALPWVLGIKVIKDVDAASRAVPV